MKKYILPLMFALLATTSFAQPNVPDQNPNYQQSRSRYMAMKDSLARTQGTTVQNTYVAYDWMALRQERKDIRFMNRQQRRLNRSMNNGYLSYYSYGYSGSPYYRSGYYYNRYGNGNYYYNRYRPNASNFFWWFLY